MFRSTLVKAGPLRRLGSRRPVETVARGERREAGVGRTSADRRLPRRHPYGRAVEGERVARCGDHRGTTHECRHENTQPGTGAALAGHGGDRNTVTRYNDAEWVREPTSSTRRARRDRCAASSSPSAIHGPKTPMRAVAP